MASLLSPATAPLPQARQPLWVSSTRSAPHAARLPSGAARHPVRCSAAPAGIPELLKSVPLENSEGLLSFFSYGLSQLQGVVAGLPEIERWEVLVFVGVSWLYLTARPGVLVGAIDAYLLAPLQLGLDRLLGRRNLRMSDFVLGERLGEGSFGVVYYGAIVPKDVIIEERVGKRRTRLEVDDRFKEKVILKKVSSPDPSGLPLPHTNAQLLLQTLR